MTPDAMPPDLRRLLDEAQVGLVIAIAELARDLNDPMKHFRHMPGEFVGHAREKLAAPLFELVAKAYRQGLCTAGEGQQAIEDLATIRRAAALLLVETGGK